MFIVNDDLSIYLTRGDFAHLYVSATDGDNVHYFQPGDVLRFKVFERKACENVVFEKYFPVTNETARVEIVLNEEETSIGEVISKPKDYWYEVELNPFTNPQTIIGYDDDGAKVLKLFPEGKELEHDETVEPEDIPIVDEELDVSSERPVQNRAVAEAMLRLEALIKKETAALSEEVASLKLILETSQSEE